MGRLSYPYVGEEPDRGLSQDVWKHVLARINNGADAYYYENNFQKLPITAVDSTVDENSQSGGGAGDITLSILTTKLDGVYNAALGTTDNAEWFTKLPITPVCNINIGNGAMAFECCFQVSKIAANDMD